MKSLLPCPFCGSAVEKDGGISCPQCWNRRAPLKPDPEKWDDITAAGIRITEIMLYDEGDGMPPVSICSCDENMHFDRQDGDTLGEALNAVRRKIGVPER